MNVEGITVIDRIMLTGLRVFGRHGVFEKERRDGQELIVDITVWLDLSKAIAGDDLRETVHYGQLARLAAEVVAGPSCNLIETLAARIADGVIDEHQAHAVEVTVHKPSAPIPIPFGDVSVTVHRRNVA